MYVNFSFSVCLLQTVLLYMITFNQRVINIGIILSAADYYEKSPIQNYLVLLFINNKMLKKNGIFRKIFFNHKNNLLT